MLCCHGCDSNTFPGWQTFSHSALCAYGGFQTHGGDGTFGHVAVVFQKAGLCRPRPLYHGYSVRKCPKKMQQTSSSLAFRRAAGEGGRCSPWAQSSARPGGAPASTQTWRAICFTSTATSDFRGSPPRLSKLVHKADTKGPASGQVRILKGCRILREGVTVNDGQLLLAQRLF